MVIYICCAGSGTSLEYATWIKEQLNNSDKVLVDFMANVTEKYDSGELDKYDLVLAHGSGFVLIPRYFEEKKFKEIINMVYLMPQVACAKKGFDSYLAQFGIPTIALTPKILKDVILDNKQVLKYLKEHVKQYNLNCPIEF